MTNIITLFFLRETEAEFNVSMTSCYQRKSKNLPLYYTFPVHEGAESVAIRVSQ